jgi:hypothetical protein
MIDFKALGARAAAEGKDMTQAQAGGGDYTPPPEGPCRVRFIGYIELGKQKQKVKGIEQIKDMVQLVFEVHGKAYPAHVADDGTKTPVRISIETNLSLNEKAHFYKLFQRMNHTQQAKHMAELLGNGYKAQIVHDKWTGQDGKERITATLKAADGYTIQPARVEDDEVEGGWRALEVPPAISSIRCFLWDYADLDQWGSLFIDGEFPERKNDKGEVIAKAKSKNVFQDRIKRAVNFGSSPMYALLTAGGAKLDIPDAEDGEGALGKPEQSASPTSPSEQVAKLAAGGADALSGIC